MNQRGRISARHKNQTIQSASELVGIVEGVLSDKTLNDQEIHFLNAWLQKHEAVSSEWPGDILHGRIKDVLADGVVTDEERKHLIQTLNQLIGGSLDRMEEPAMVTQLCFDKVDYITFEDSLFVLTGDFIIGSRARCIEILEDRGAEVEKNITQSTDYLLVGALGSDEWKGGSYGTKILRAVGLKQRGIPIQIVHEQTWEQYL